MFKLGRFYILFLFFLICNLQNSYSIIILLNGPTCAGKSSIAKMLLKNFNTDNSWVLVSLDSIISRGKLHKKSSDDGLVRDQWHKKTINFIKNNLKRNVTNIIIDTVLDREKDFNLLKKELSIVDKTVFKVFVYCSFDDTIQHWENRNKLQVVEEYREFSQIVHAFGKFYTKNKSTKKGLGCLPYAEFEGMCREYIKKNPDRAMWTLSRNYSVFNKEFDKLPLKLAFGENDYNLIIDSSKNSSEKCASEVVNGLIKFMFKKAKL